MEEKFIRSEHTIQDLEMFRDIDGYIDLEKVRIGV